MAHIERLLSCSTMWRNAEIHIEEAIQCKAMWSIVAEMSKLCYLLEEVIFIQVYVGWIHSMQKQSEKHFKLRKKLEAKGKIYLEKMASRDTAAKDELHLRVSIPIGGCLWELKLKLKALVLQDHSRWRLQRQQVQSETISDRCIYPRGSRSPQSILSSEPCSRRRAHPDSPCSRLKAKTSLDLQCSQFDENKDCKSWMSARTDVMAISISLSMGDIDL